MPKPKFKFVDRPLQETLETFGNELRTGNRSKITVRNYSRMARCTGASRTSSSSRCGLTPKANWWARAG